MGRHGFSCASAKLRVSVTRRPSSESFFPSRSRGLLSRAKNRESNPAALNRNPHRPSFISSRTISRSRILHRSPSKNRPREKIIRAKSRSWWKLVHNFNYESDWKNITHDIVITIERFNFSSKLDSSFRSVERLTEKLISLTI